MKSTHYCPKCDSTKIVYYKGKSHHQGTIGATTKWGIVSGTLDRYFCINCGYTEEYVRLDKKFLKWANAELEKQGGGFNDGFV